MGAGTALATVPSNREVSAACRLHGQSGKVQRSEGPHGSIGTPSRRLRAWLRVVGSRCRGGVGTHATHLGTPGGRWLPSRLAMELRAAFSAHCNHHGELSPPTGLLLPDPSGTSSACLPGSQCGSLGEGHEGKPQRVGPREAAGSAMCRPPRRAKRVAPRGRGQEGVAGPCAQRGEVRAAAERH